MNVSICVYPWAFDTPGGGERQLQNYVSALERGRARWPDLAVSLYDMWNPQLQSTDLMHYFGCMPSSVDFLSHVKSVRRVPLVISPNFWPDPEGWAKSGVLDQIKTILWLADLVIVNSFVEEEALVRLMKIDSSRIAKVYNAVDESYFERADPALFRREFDVQGPYVLNVANAEPRKNQLAFLKVLKEFPELTLITIGGRRDAEYAAACEAEGGGQFRLLPPLPPSDPLLRSAMAGCDFFAMPSTVETPSIASLEAAAIGARVLTTGFGSVHEYFKDYVTYVNPFDPYSLSVGIHEVRRAKVDPALSRMVREQYTWDAVIGALVEAYGRATQKTILRTEHD